MKFLNIKIIPIAFLLATLIILAPSCDDEPEFPITNDLRVLQINIGSNSVSSGATDLSVIPQIEVVFSHSLNAAAFEGALSITPSVDFAVSYDASGSFATISFPTPLEYETAYSIRLATGTYGANGEASVEDFVFDFTTAAFEPATVNLSANTANFFEGETVQIVATLDRAILEAVTLDIALSGTAVDGTDYNVDGYNFTIPAGAISDTILLTAQNDGAIEGEETITLTIQNLVNSVAGSTAQLDLTLGDEVPALELKGVMELDNFLSGSGGRVRAIHVKVTDNITDLSVYGIEIASNGAAPNPTNINFTFPSGSATTGDNLFIVRDIDEADAMTYFGSCYTNFTVFTSPDITHNGNDAILLYNNGVAIESFGEPGVDGTGTYWEYTDSWAYKLGDEWIYAGVGCVTSNDPATTNATSECKYPFCANALQLQGVGALLWSGSGANGGKFVHVRANQDIPDLSVFGLGIANNGGGSDGIEFTFPAIAVFEGEHILVAREPGTIASYFGNCFNEFAQTLQSEAMNQNGDDAVELFQGSTVIETYGQNDVDGTGQPWEYAGSWAFKVGKWTYGGLGCAAGSSTTQSSACPYVFCQ